MPSLAELLVEIGVDFAPMDAGARQAVPRAMRHGEAAGEAYGQGMGRSLRGIFYDITGGIAMARSALEFAGVATGVNIAAQYADVDVQLQAVTGNAEKARRAMELFTQIGLESPFDTREIAAFGSVLLTMGDDIAKVGDDLRGILDAAAFAGVERARMPRFMRNLTDIRGMVTPNKRDVDEMLRAGPGMARIFAAGMGRDNMTPAEINLAKATMSGQEFYDTILRGSEVLAKGAAAARGLSSPIAFVGNLLESLNLAMMPTGSLLLAILMPLGSFIKGMSDAFGWINKMTGGFAGLLAIIGLLYAGRTLIAAVFLGAIRYTRELAAALIAYSGAARTATAATALATVSTGVGAGAAAAGGAAAGAGAAAGWAARAGGILSGLRGLMGSLVRGGGIFGLVSLGADLAGNALGQKSPVGSNLLKNIGGFGGWGALIGGGIGAMFGGVGAGPGAAIGFGLGSMLGIGKSMFDIRQPDFNPEDREHTAALRENTQAIRTMTGGVIGGGDRARRVSSQLDRELALVGVLGYQ